MRCGSSILVIILFRRIFGGQIVTNEHEEAAVEVLGAGYKLRMHSIALFLSLHFSPEMCRYMSFSLSWYTLYLTGVHVAERLREGWIRDSAV